MWCLSSAGYLVGVVDGDVVVEVDLPSQPDWTWCAYHAELDIVVCASQSGALVSVHCPDQHVDVIGHFDFGIRGMRWSPNDEQVALVTGDGQFLTLSTTWNVMHESPCSSCAIDGLVQLSWRADGKFVSIQGPFSLHATLSLQVWAVDNAVWTLHAQGRHEDKSELALQGQGLHWSPNHALIASSEVFKNQLHVAFFETNGLRHGEMALPVDASASVTHLSWNLASDVLAVVTSTSSSGSSPSSMLQLWTRRNYHWYLKHTREYESPVSALQWDLEQIAGISTLYPSQVVTMDVETGTLETTDYHEVVSTISNNGCHVQLSQSKAIWPQGVVQLSNGHTLWTEWEVVQCSTVVVQLAQTKLFVNNTLLHASVASFHVIPTLGYLALTTLGAKSEFRLYPLDALRQGTFVPELALRHLHAAGPSYHSECVELVKSHHLYDIGLTLFPSASLLRTPIVSAYGRHLTAQAKYTQAGYTFLSIRAFEDAIEAFKRAQEWHMALALVPQVPSLNLASVAYALAEELVNRNELKDAARIYIEYCQDVDEGIATLLLGRYYADALHMALLLNRSDLVETDVHPAVEQAALDVEEEYEAKLESFQTHWTRLTTLRDQIRLFRLHGIDGKAADDDDGAKDSASSAAASALSQSSSVSSVGSHNSNRDIKFGGLSVTSLAITSSYNHGRASTTSSPSSTMKKKMPRRFRRSKIQQGSAEEDAYVLQSLGAAVPSADDLGHVRRVMQVLLYFGHVQQVTSIQGTIQRCLTHMAAHPIPPPVHGDAVSFDVPPVDDSWLVLPMSM
ncbi:hypothetical protein DYB35_003078 [Aphanomyces astaci]|uniref:Elongator complex protein 1 n=1 Tax=Aphanomyces astaci TaxID=112090 RepID=A0A3R7A9Z1_APHAT|nr:hypothetical protein DYB35_003078 [Aphanomyces astaci]